MLVRRPDCAAQAEQIVRDFGFKKVVAYADGGVERQNSVWNGLDRCEGRTEIVAVHDGARLLVTPELIEATIRSARAHGTGIAATKVVDTIKEADENRMIVRTVDRTRLWAVQTPQTVRFKLLREAYALVFEEELDRNRRGRRGGVARSSRPLGGDAVPESQDHRACRPRHC